MSLVLTAKVRKDVPVFLEQDDWKFEDIADHWSRIELTCWIKSNGIEELYQQGTCGDLMSPKALIEKYKQMSNDQNGNIVYSGTIGSALTYGDEYVIEMKDPVLDRLITHHYLLEYLL
jgi:hypothetical protein